MLLLIEEAWFTSKLNRKLQNCTIFYFPGWMVVFSLGSNSLANHSWFGYLLFYLPTYLSMDNPLALLP